MTSVNHNNANGNDVATSPCTPLTPLTPTPRQHKRIAVVGAGSVGASVCYALLLRGIGAELLLVDIDRARCEGEVLDLTDGGFIADTRVRVGTPQEAGQCDVVVITAGAKQRPGETRLELIGRNFQSISFLKAVIGGMQPLNPNCMLLVVANPVDILTYFAQKLSGLPGNQVFGSGTFLDTMRLRVALAEKMKVAQTAVHVYVMGEHGDTQFPVWSAASIAGIPFAALPELQDQKELDSMAEASKNKAYTIIKAKGATYFGIAAVVSSICESIFLDKKNVRMLSVYSPQHRVCTSFPCVLGSAGVDRVVPLHERLTKEERARFDGSVASLRKVIDEYEPMLMGTTTK